RWAKCGWRRRTGRETWMQTGFVVKSVLRFCEGEAGTNGARHHDQPEDLVGFGGGAIGPAFGRSGQRGGFAVDKGPARFVGEGDEEVLQRMHAGRRGYGAPGDWRAQRAAGIH